MTARLAPLSSVIGGPLFTKSCSQYDSYCKRQGRFDFSRRFDAEEVEWILNTPLDIFHGRTVVHTEVLRKHIDALTCLGQVLELGGKNCLL